MEMDTHDGQQLRDKIERLRAGLPYTREIYNVIHISTVRN